jgi:hypothetical protein
VLTDYEYFTKQGKESEVFGGCMQQSVVDMVKIAVGSRVLFLERII